MSHRFRPRYWVTLGRFISGYLKETKKIYKFTGIKKRSQLGTDKNICREHFSLKLTGMNHTNKISLYFNPLYYR